LKYGSGPFEYPLFVMIPHHDADPVQVVLLENRIKMFGYEGGLFLPGIDARVGPTKRVDEALDRVEIILPQRWI